MQVIRYIHLNPKELLDENKLLSSHSYSSYPTYLGINKVGWLNAGTILSQIKDYREFVEGSPKDEPEEMAGYLLDDADSASGRTVLYKDGPLKGSGEQNAQQ